MSIFSRRKIEIDPDDHELVKNMSAQSSETKLFQTETINITKITQDIRNQEIKSTRKNKKKEYRPSSMSESFMPTSLKQKESLKKSPKQLIPTEYIEIDDEEIIEDIRPLDAKIQFATEIEHPVVYQRKDSGITSELDQVELTDYMQKTQRVNRLMVSLIVTLIVVVVVIAIIIVILNLRKSGQSSPLGGV
ncbi:MAG: hypothetical protein ACRCV7_05500 [Culicoidibacterales bacterium]